MRIVALVADGVRNLRPLQLEPRERFNVFVGDNGQGKTNLLEAIYVISTLRSFRTSRLTDLVAFGTTEARLGARVVKDELVRLYEVDLAPGSRKVRLDGKAVRPLARYFGGFNVVVFTPEDLALPRGSPGDRRRFLAVLAPALATAFSSITRTGLVASARYVSKLVGRGAHEIEAELAAGRARDLATQSTQLGPHRDDLALELEDREAGSFASQGQLRAIMLAWKTAELSVLGTAHGDAPILLLDDVSSELDAARNEYLFDHLATLAGQCFITTTHASHVLLQRDRADYRIQTGQILE